MLEGELRREEASLIASGNDASLRVLEAQGFVPTKEYAEGYPGRR